MYRERERERKREREREMVEFGKSDKMRKISRKVNKPKH